MAMKPPGGESRDLWGAEFKGTPCHHRVLKPPGGGSSDIFGPSEPVQNSPRRIRNNLQSSVFGPPAANGEATPRTKPDGNPVTGEGYAAEKQPSPVSNGQPAANGVNGAPASAPASAPAQRSRVPPGGFSSGLW